MRVFVCHCDEVSLILLCVLIECSAPASRLVGLMSVPADAHTRACVLAYKLEGGGERGVQGFACARTVTGGSIKGSHRAIGAAHQQHVRLLWVPLQRRHRIRHPLQTTHGWPCVLHEIWLGLACFQDLRARIRSLLPSRTQMTALAHVSRGWSLGQGGCSSAWSPENTDSQDCQA